MYYYFLLTNRKLSSITITPIKYPLGIQMEGKTLPKQIMKYDKQIH